MLVNGTPSGLQNKKIIYNNVKAIVLRQPFVISFVKGNLPIFLDRYIHKCADTSITGKYRKYKNTF